MTSTQNTTRATLPRLRGRKPANATTILGLVLVPFVIAGLFIWGLWNPTERLQDVTAAVVNLDEPVELDGQLVPLGRVLAGELIGGPKQASDQANFTWILTDEEEAEAGLKDGKYATIVTIPETFSAAATSMSGDADEVRQARIDITESDRGRLIDTALSGIVTQTATRVLNEQLGTQSVSALFGGMTELSEGIGGAADGAKKLADGNTQLATGVKGVADGTTELASGTSELASGTSELASGAGELADGTAQLATGASGLAQGMRAFTSGDGTAENPGLNGYAAGLGALVHGNGGDNPGMVTYLQGVDAYATGVGDTLSAVRDPLAQLFAGLEGNVDALKATLAAIESGLLPLPPEIDKDQLVTALSTAIQAIENGGLDEALDGFDDLTAGSYAVAGGAKQYAGALPGIADGANQLAAGSEQLTQGAEQLSSGVGGLSAGASALASGTNELASGTNELAAGTNELATGTSKLAEGSDAAAKGTRELAGGLREAADGIPSYTDEQAENLAKTAVTPVKAEGGSDEIFSGAGLPFFAGIALWAGALASFLVLAPLWSRTRDAARSVGWITLRSAGPAAAIGAAQGAIAGIVLPAALQYDFQQGTAFFCLAVLAGVAFALIVQGLSALLGGLGRFLAFGLLVVGFVVGIVSTVPAGLAAVGDASPIGAAFSGFQAVAADTGGAGLAAFLLILWGLGGLVLTAFGVMRARAAHKK